MIRLYPLLFITTALLSCAGCRKAVQASSGMEPTIKAGETVTINYLAYSSSAPARWDVVALEPPFSTNEVVLKRIIALPSETISLTSSGIVINGSLVAMPNALSNVVYYAMKNLPQLQSISPVTFPYTVPAKHYFVVGDNWANSLDSRHYGAVAQTNILGRLREK